MGGDRRRVAGVLSAALLFGLLAGCAAAESPKAPDQVSTIGVLRAVRSLEPGNIDVFLAELAQAGFATGGNLRVLGADPTEVHADPVEAESVVREWARDRLDLVVALSSSGAMAAARAAPGTNVLFLSNDPSAVGLLGNERRPEGRLTGMTFRVPADRTLELARQAIPGMAKAGFLYPASDPASRPALDAFVRAGASLGVEIALGPFAAAEDIGGVIDDLRSQGIDCLVLANAPTTLRNYPSITAALASGPVPVVTNTTADFALIVLEPDTREIYRQLGRQAVRLLRGAPPSEVPVEDPGRFRFILSTLVADRLGLQIPPDVIRTADTVVRP